MLRELPASLVNISEFAPKFSPDAEKILIVLSRRDHCIGPYQPSVVEWQLITNFESHLRSFRGSILGVAKNIQSRDLEDDLLMKIEEIFETERAAISVVSGSVHCWKTSQIVGFK